jgi:5-methylcytosine-specific restriction endonuclease McrA
MYDPGTLITLEEALYRGGHYSERNRRHAVQILLNAGYLLTLDGQPYTVPLPPRPKPTTADTSRRTRKGFSKDTRQAIWDKTRGHCWYCGTPTPCDDAEFLRYGRWLESLPAHAEIWEGTDGVTISPPHEEPYHMSWERLAVLGMRRKPSLDLMTVDHVVPWQDGGTHALSNLVPACRPCNARKGTMSLEEFREVEARRDLPLFTAEHIAYLEKLQIPLPPDFPCYPHHVFWGEEHAND